MAMSREIRVGLFLVVAFLILIALFELVGKETIFARMLEYRTSFKSIPGLKLGDPVRLAGVDVGTVRDIRVIGARVEVAMRVKPETPVKTDSIATIKLTSLLGTNFVDLTFGSPAAQTAPDGSLLQSSEPPDLNTLLVRLNDAAGDIQTLAKQVNEGLGKSIEPISSAFQTMDKIAKKIEKGEGTLGRLIADDGLYREIRGMAADLHQVSDQIAKGQGTLGKLVNDEALYNDMRGAVASLNGIMKKVERGEGTLGKLVNDESLYFTAKDSLKKMGKAADQLQEQGPLSIIGIGIQALGAW